MTDHQRSVINKRVYETRVHEFIFNPRGRNLGKPIEDGRGATYKAIRRYYRQSMRGSKVFPSCFEENKYN